MWRLRHMLALQIARVQSFELDDTVVALDLRMQLAVAAIERVNAGGGTLEEQLTEAAGRGTDIECHTLLGRQREVIKRGRKLHAAAGDVGMSRLISNIHGLTQPLGRLGDFRAVCSDAAGLDR